MKMGTPTKRQRDHHRAGTINIIRLFSSLPRRLAVGFNNKSSAIAIGTGVNNCGSASAARQAVSPSKASRKQEGNDGNSSARNVKEWPEEMMVGTPAMQENKTGRGQGKTTPLPAVETV